MIIAIFAGDDESDDKALSADITQDVFFKLWERRTDFTDQLKIRSFLYTAVHNMALNELAHRRIDPFIDLLVKTVEPNFFLMQKYGNGPR